MKEKTKVKDSVKLELYDKDGNLISIREPDKAKTLLERILRKVLR
jgi:hypothetical protein